MTWGWPPAIYGTADQTAAQTALDFLSLELTKKPCLARLAERGPNGFRNMLLILNLPLIGIWVRLLRVPYRLLFPIIMTMMGIGIYSLNNSGTDVLLMSLFGFVGYILVKLGCSFPPLILAMVLGPLLEENLRRSLLLSDGDPSVFFTRPLSCAFMIATAALLLLFTLPALRKR